MTEWKLSTKDIKQYPHFDAPLRPDELERIANDPEAVAAHRFYPFLKYTNTYQPYAGPKKDMKKRRERKDPKEREIRYASHCDAVIYSRYRSILSERYEAELTRLGISDCVLAYRRVLISPESQAGKSNINHAKAAFDLVREYGDCCAITLDIKSYFESIDHSRIKDLWKRLLGVEELPIDHYKVFRAITKYAVVDSRKAYTALGYFGVKPDGLYGYLLPKNEVPKQLCSPEKFLEIICGNGVGRKNLISKNKASHGIPQGAPLSDLLANLYLIDFDVEMKEYVSSFGGEYMRYSDDIILLAPVDQAQAEEMMRHVEDRIQSYGSELRISSKKCTIDTFTQTPEGLRHEAVYPSGKGRNGLNYLGFRFDGRHVYLRDSTLSNFRRKMARAVKANAHHMMQRFTGKDLPYLESKLNTDELIERFGRVDDFRYGTDKKSWTF